MSRILILTLLALSSPGAFFLGVAHADRQDGPARKPPQAQVRKDGIPWNASDHPHYFRYQAYLAARSAKQGVSLQFETEDGWKTLKPGERATKVEAGEATLKGQFERLLENHRLTPEEEEFLEAVWGADIAKGFKTVAAARTLKDPSQVQAALDKVGALSKKLGTAGIDWGGVFDLSRSAKGQVDAKPSGEGQDGKKGSPFAPRARKGFLDSLESEEVKAVLKDEHSFEAFLDERIKFPVEQVDKDAKPGLMAMYRVLDSANAQEKKELGHILPTTVKFIMDGRKIVKENMGGALGFAVSGDYDKPEKVGITDAVKSADPYVAAKTLAHEFQHIYDMYAGRYYTLDSELRGFKTAVLFFRVLKRSSKEGKDEEVAAAEKELKSADTPEKRKAAAERIAQIKRTPDQYEDLVNSDDDTTRGILRDAEKYSKSYDQGPVAFYQAVAVGHRYNKWEEGVFEGRKPLREAVNPTFGAPRDLEAKRALVKESEAEVALLAKAEKELAAARKKDRSHELQHRHEKAIRDLGGARQHLANLQSDAGMMEIRITRMQSEVDWLDRKSKEKGEKEPPPFDLSLPVDRSYNIP